MDGGGDAGCTTTVICCPICEQDTNVSADYYFFRVQIRCNKIKKDLRC